MGEIKILIVEDDTNIQKLYDIGLPEEEYEKKFSDNGIDALESYKSWNPDIIILDIGLPQMDGYSVLKKIREEITDENTTIVMATGVNEKHKILDCIKLGISAYIVKPFLFKEINQSIMKAYKSDKLSYDKYKTLLGGSK